MSVSREFGRLLAQLKTTSSNLERLRIVERAWRTVRRLTPQDRLKLAREVGIAEAGEWIERLARSKGASPEVQDEIRATVDRLTTPEAAPLFSSLYQPEGRKDSIRRGLGQLADRLAEGPAQEELIQLGLNKPGRPPQRPPVPANQVRSDQPPPPSTPPPAPARPTPAARSAPIAPRPEQSAGAASETEIKAPVRQSPGQIKSQPADGLGVSSESTEVAALISRPQPRDSSEPGTGLSRNQPATVSVPVSAGSAPEAKRLSDTAFAGSMPPAAAGRTAAGPLNARTDKRLSRRVSPPARVLPRKPRAADTLPDTLQQQASLTRRFRLLNNSLAEPLEPAQLRPVLEAFPTGWPRRRALTALIQSGSVENIEQLKSLLGALEKPSDQSWCLAAWLKQLPRTGEELQELAALASSSRVRRLIERQRG